jgi:hypothetical protein
MSAVIAWIKSNVASVIFIVVMVAALVSLPILAGKMNAGIQEDMTSRVGKLKELNNLEKTDITVGNPIYGTQVSRTELVNERLLERLIEVTEAERADADRVVERAVEHNRKGRGVILPRLFPAPPPAEREVLPERFHGMVETEYDRLLERVGAGSPPTVEAMTQDLDARRAQFLTNTLQKDESEGLTEEEAGQLTEFLTEQRMSRYAEQADEVGIYATKDALGIPGWNQAVQPTMWELYEWQWQYWIIEDVLEALAEANRGDGERYSVQQAPAKRVLSVAVYGQAAPASGGDEGQSGFGASRKKKSSGGARKARSNPSQEVVRDYGLSFTGRETNPLYDVRLVEVRLIVDTARLPAVLDAFARRNFMTVRELDMFPADQYAAASDGYFYGSEPVTEVTLLVETIWLRSWTTPFMPDEVKTSLGISVEAPKDS